MGSYLKMTNTNSNHIWGNMIVHLRAFVYICVHFELTYIMCTCCVHIILSRIYLYIARVRINVLFLNCWISIHIIVQHDTAYFHFTVVALHIARRFDRCACHNIRHHARIRVVPYTRRVLTYVFCGLFNVEVACTFNKYQFHLYYVILVHLLGSGDKSGILEHKTLVENHFLATCSWDRRHLSV